MGTVKQSFEIQFADRVSATVYTEDIARRIVRGESDPAQFTDGTVTRVTRHVTEWFGDHDDPDNPRRFVDLLSVDMPPELLAVPHADYPHNSGQLIDCLTCHSLCWCGDLRHETQCVHCAGE